MEYLLFRSIILNANSLALIDKQPLNYRIKFKSINLLKIVFDYFKLIELNNRFLYYKEYN